MLPEQPGGRLTAMMQWHPTAGDIVNLRIVGLTCMALIFGVRFIPSLRRHARLIGLVAAVAYIAVGVTTILIHSF